MNNSKVILIGYSGHAFIVYSILHSIGKEAFAYCDITKKKNNPFNLKYLGTEMSQIISGELLKNNFFISIGDNNIRSKVYEVLANKNAFPINAIHSTAIICSSASVNKSGVMISAGAIINPLSKIGKGVICNTRSVIEHECIIGDFAHIAPGAILNGNVEIGKRTFIGSNAVIKQGIKICNDAIIGMGTCVIKDIIEPGIYVGNPAKRLILSNKI